MTIVEEVIAFSRDYCSDKKNQTKERQQKIVSAYRQVMGKTLDHHGCGVCFIEALLEIKKMMEKEACRYRLKPDALLQSFGDESKTCTNATLTDELAEFHLRTNPGCAKLFSVIPAMPEPEKELEIMPVDEEYQGYEQEEIRPKRSHKAKK